MRRGALRWVSKCGYSRAAALWSVAAEPLGERFGVDSQSLARGHLGPSEALQCPASVAALQLADRQDRLTKVERRGGRRAGRQMVRQVGQGCDVLRAEHRASLDEVLELSDVARPYVAGEGVDRVWSQPNEAGLRIPSPSSLDKMLEQAWEVVQMLAQPEVVPALLEAENAAQIYQRLADAERRLEPVVANL